LSEVDTIPGLAVLQTAGALTAGSVSAVNAGLCGLASDTTACDEWQVLSGCSKV